jgi:hypothetical protein
MCQESYDEGYDVGYDDGQSDCDDGYEIGYSDGKDDGYSDGYDNGYNLGYDDGCSDEIDESHEIYPSFNEKLNLLFCNLQAHNFLTMQKAACCMSCSCALLSPIAEESGKFGIAYNHDQDWESDEEIISMAVRYASIDGDFMAEAGNIIAQVALDLGLEVIWDGNWDKVIYVEMSE